MGQTSGVGRRPLLILDPMRLACAAMVMAHHYAAMLPIAPPAFLRAAAAGLDMAAGHAA